MKTGHNTTLTDELFFPYTVIVPYFHSIHFTTPGRGQLINPTMAKLLHLINDSAKRVGDPNVIFLVENTQLRFFLFFCFFVLFC